MSYSEPIWWRRAPGLRGITRYLLVDQVRWRAFEYVLDSIPRNVSLIFACETAWRRLRTFPFDWANQDDAALLALGGF
jgi:hypothetical protein